MSRFATIKEKNKTLTTNYAGGQSYKQKPELELASILLTSFTNDKFYRSFESEKTRLKELIKVVDPELVCKSAVYARQVVGMRSISHVLTAEVAKLISGKPYAREFYNAVVRRPDDMSEILSYGKSSKWGYKTMPKAMQRGFKDAFSKFDEYQIAKWRKPNNEINLLNILHLTHPIPNDTLNALYKNKLKVRNTRESVLSETGKIENKFNLTQAQIAETKAEKLKEGWRNLILEKKIAYKALIGSLVKIINEAPEVINEVCDIIKDFNLIKKSLIMPSELIVAYEQVSNLSNSKSRQVLSALNLALENSLSNAPKFEGETLVVLDCSGSMKGKPALIGSLFAAVLCKINHCDLMVFSNSADYKSYDPNDSITTIANSIKFSYGGTNFRSIFDYANKKYDRVVILSDMQGWVGYYSPTDTYNNYCRRYQANPYIYSWDLAGYGTTQFPSNKIFALAGFTSNTFDVMKNLEKSESNLLDEINKINFRDYTRK